MDVKHKPSTFSVCNKWAIDSINGFKWSLFAVFNLFLAEMFYHSLDGRILWVKMCGYGIGMPVDSISEIQLSVNGSKVIKVQKQCWGSDEKKGKNITRRDERSKRMYRIAWLDFW